MPYNLIFDSTSKTIKAAIVDNESNIIAWELDEPEILRTEDGFGRAFNHQTFGSLLEGVAKKAIKKAQIHANQIRYITACSIRPSAVFTDGKNTPLYMAASFDVCGIESADEIESRFHETTGKTLYQSTGHTPSLLFAPAKYAAIRERFNNEQPEVKIEQYMPMDSWILVHLGAEPHANFTSAAESGFFDLQTRCWHDVWPNLLDLPDDFFQIPVQSGEIVGSVSEEMQKKLGFSSECELVAGLPDTQSALLGLGCIHAGSSGVVMGSTTPVQCVLDTLFLDDQQRTWASLFSVKNLCDKYIMETNTGITGQIVKWAANLFYSEDKGALSDRYTKLNQAYATFDKKEFEMTPVEVTTKSAYGFLGPQPLASSSAGMTPGVFYFPTPGGTEETELTPPTLIGATMDDILFGIYSNIEISRNIMSVMGITPSQLCITGGISRNLTLCQRMTDLHQSPIGRASDPESTIIGLNFLCLVAAGKIRSEAELSNHLNTHQMIQSLEPRVPMREKIKEKYETWQRLRKNLMNI